MQVKQERFIDQWLHLQRRYLPYVLAGAGVYIVLTLVIYFFAGGSKRMEFEFSHLVLLADIIMLPIAAYNCIFLFQHFFGKSIQAGWKMIAIKICATIIGVIAMSSMLEWIYSLNGYVDDDFIVLGENTLSPALSNVIEYAVLAMAIGLPRFIWQLRIQELSGQLREKELEQERLIQLKTQAELHALQSRINPHFLFNSFNSIASLISSNPESAEQMMLGLSTLFRYSLNFQNHHFVSIKEELKIVRTYLEIEKIRFGENLSYKIEIDERLEPLSIPRFLIQPLVENALVHAVSKMKHGEVVLRIYETKDDLLIELFDNGPIFPLHLKKGYGLQSTQEKLALLYPNNYELELLHSPSKHVSIRINKKARNAANI